MKYYLLLSTLLIAACKNAPDTKEKKMVQSLIYDKEWVRLVSKSGGDKVVAEKYFQEGERKFRKEKNTKDAISSFVASISACPTGRSYFELGNVYIDAKHYDSAIMAYKMAEAMDYRPLPQLLYNVACAYSLNHDRWEAGKYLQYAIEAGYNNTKHMLSDPDLKDPEYGFALEEEYLDAIDGQGDAQTLWNSFSAAFTALALPLVINKQTDKCLDKKPRLSYKYEHFVAEMQSRAMFSREGGDVIFAYGKVATKPEYSLLIYVAGADRDMSGETSGNYWLVSYSTDGRQIDKLHIAGVKGMTGLCDVFSMNADYTFQVKEFQNTYAKSLKEYGYYDNPVTGVTLKTVKDYKVNEQGRFVEITPAVGSECAINLFLLC